MVWSNLSTLLSGVVNAISRKYEYQADAFAVEQGYGLDLKIALTKLNVENASSVSLVGRYDSEQSPVLCGTLQGDFCTGEEDSVMVVSFQFCLLTMSSIQSVGRSLLSRIIAN